MLRNSLLFLAYGIAIAQGQTYPTYIPPVYVPPPMPRITVPKFEPIQIPKFEPIQVPVMQPMRVYEVPRLEPIKSVFIPLVPVMAVVRPAEDTPCEAEAAARRTDIERAQNEVRSAELELQNLQFRYQDISRHAQQAQQAANSLAWSAQSTKGGWAWLFAGGSIAGSVNSMQLNSQAQSLQWQVNNAEFQVNMAHSRLSSLPTSPSHDCSIDPLSAEALRALKKLGVQCFQGGELRNLVASSVRPKAFTETQGLTRPAASNVNALTSRQPVTAAASIGGIARLRDIEAALYRPDSQDLLLIGPAASGAEGLSPDDWLVAYRSVLGAEPLGVSIDPGPDTKEMLVRYLGGSRGTHLGTTLFEADRILKILSSGYDNLSCSAWPSMPQGFATELDLIEADLRAGQDLPNGGWHRFWFEPTETPVEMTADGHGIRIPTNRWVVREQSVPAGRPSPPRARIFAENLTGKFMDLRAGIPVFAELQRVASLVYIAKWVRDQSLPGETLWKEKPVEPVETPMTTPSIAVMRGAASGPSYLRYGIQGGVDFYQPNRYATASPMSAALLQGASRAETRGTSSWGFVADGVQYVAVRLKVDRPMSSGAEWVASPRPESVMEQPAVERLQFPDRRIRIKNETGQPLHVEFSGPVKMTGDVAVNETGSFQLVPGVYTTTAKSDCGSKTSPIDITEHVTQEVRYSCQTLVAPR
jgi:hypothetical protein